MVKTVELTFADGSRMHVEGSESVTSVGERGLGDVIERVTEPFDAALGTLRSIADGLHASLKSTASPPTGITVHFGLNFSGEYGVVLAKGSVGANLEITMEWKKV